jgi:VWA domain-containing protein
VSVSTTLPLTDAQFLWRYARRTRRIRLGLAIALLAVFGIDLWSAFHLRTRPTSYFAQGGSGIVVVDISASVDPRANVKLATLLRSLADSDQRLGLVAFAEQAYELLPPGTRGDEIRPLLRFFGSEQPLLGPPTPWSRSFLGGTTIGQGLRLARQIIQRAGGGSALLISDLQDSGTDVPLLTEELSLYRRGGIGLRVLPLYPNDEALGLFTGLLPASAFVSDTALEKNAGTAERQTVVASFPVWLVLLEALLLLGLAANEYAGRSLRWRTA